MSANLPPEDEPTEAPELAAKDAVGSLLELLAMALAATAGFLAPTDWNLTFGFGVIAVALFTLGFFALATS